MKKIFFLTEQDILGRIQNGGMQCAERNWKLLNNYAEEHCLYVRIIGKESEEKQTENIKYFKRIGNNFEALISTLFMTKTYLPSEYKKILQDIQEIEPDILFLDTSLLGKVLRDVNKEIKKMVFFHNVESEYARHKVKEAGIRFLPSYFTALYNEKCAIKYADWKICLNQRDSKMLGHKYGQRADFLLPISFEDRFIEQKNYCEPERKQLLFVGSLFPPNYNGILWFIEEVMTELKEFELVVVGKDFEKKKEQLERDNVSVIGTVRSIDDYYYSYGAVVMPILYGDGMKVKTAEAMMFGKTIFATTEALEGYDVEQIHTGIYCCNTKEEFIKSIRKAFQNNEILGVNHDVREFFLEYHSFNKQAKVMNRFLNQIS